jgi:archaellum biogenesis protein FlaJ (TadC family)
MEGALTWRRRAFLAWGIPALLVTLSVDTVADVFEQNSDPDAVTIGAWLFMAMDLVVLSRVLFGAPQVRKMHQRLIERKGSASIEDVGKALSFLAMSLLGAPFLMGLVLVSMSGDAWRLYVFVPISLVGGVVLWRQIEEAVRQLDSPAGGPS